MGFLDDILKALDRVEVWRELQEVPRRTAELEKRIAELENRYGGKWPPDVCRFCGARALRLYHSFGSDAKGNVREEWLCSECNQTDKRVSKPR